MSRRPPSPAIPFTGTAGAAEDVRLTDRDVILVRSDAGIRIEGQRRRPITASAFEVELGDTTFPFIRGYAWADVAVGSSPHPVHHHTSGVAERQAGPSPSRRTAQRAGREHQACRR